MFGIWRGWDPDVRAHRVFMVRRVRTKRPQQLSKRSRVKVHFASNENILSSLNQLLKQSVT